MSRKTGPGPEAATMKPPRAGPTARATLNPAAFSATADDSFPGSTSSGTIACQAGAFIAAPRPRAAVKPSSIQRFTTSSIVRAPSMPAASSIHTWVTNNKRRRSTTSARAPAGSATRKTGRLVAACTSAIMTGEVVSVVISHAAPMFCIQVPRFDTTEAIHRARNTGLRSGPHGEAFSCPAAAAALACASSVREGRFKPLAISRRVSICSSPYEAR